MYEGAATAAAAADAAAAEADIACSTMSYDVLYYTTLRQ